MDLLYIIPDFSSVGGVLPALNSKQSWLCSTLFITTLIIILFIGFYRRRPEWLTLACLCWAAALRCFLMPILHGFVAISIVTLWFPPLAIEMKYSLVWYISLIFPQTAFFFFLLSSFEL